MEEKHDFIKAFDIDAGRDLTETKKEDSKSNLNVNDAISGVVRMTNRIRNLENRVRNLEITIEKMIKAFNE